MWRLATGPNELDVEIKQQNITAMIMWRLYFVAAKLVVSEVMLDFQETCHTSVPSNITDNDVTGGHPIRELLVKIATFNVKVPKLISVIFVIPYSSLMNLQ